MPSKGQLHLQAIQHQLFQDLFSELSSAVGQFLSQPNPNCVAKCLT